MKHCKSELQSRQELQALRYQIEEVIDALYECADLDKPLQHQPDFYQGMCSLLEAANNIGALRKYASPLFLCDLERDLQKVVGE